MQALIFGAKCSPCCANYCLKLTATDNQESYDLDTVNTVLHDFYMDDVLKSVKTEAEAISLSQQLIDILAKGGFRLTKFLSNSRNVLANIPTSEVSCSVTSLDLQVDSLPVERVLGVLWNAENDSLEVKVYLVRFKLECTEQDGEECSSPEESEQSDIPELNTPPILNTGKAAVPEETQYPASISIDVLLKAGQLIKPKRKNQVSLSLEKFNLEEQEWVSVEKLLDLLVETESFSSGGFRNAFLGLCKDQQKWVIKKYNEKAVETITETLKSSVEDHTRKQIQMHCTARHLTNVFSTKAPKAFGECFKFNRAYYTVYQGQSATIEEFVEGTFRKKVLHHIFCKIRFQGLIIFPFWVSYSFISTVRHIDTHKQPLITVAYKPYWSGKDEKTACAKHGGLRERWATILKRNRQDTKNYSNVVLQDKTGSKRKAVCFSNGKRNLLLEGEQKKTTVKIRNYTFAKDLTAIYINDMTAISDPSPDEYCFQFDDPNDAIETGKYSVQVQHGDVAERSDSITVATVNDVKPLTESIAPQSYAGADAGNIPVIEKDEILFSSKDEIGRSQFGIVYKGTWAGTPVAVKSIKDVDDKGVETKDKDTQRPAIPDIPYKDQGERGKRESMSNVTCRKLLIERTNAPQKPGTLKDISLYGSFQFPTSGPHEGGLIARSLAGEGKVLTKTSRQINALSARNTPIAGATGATTSDEMPPISCRVNSETGINAQVYSVQFIQHPNEHLVPVATKPLNEQIQDILPVAGYGLKKGGAKRTIFTQAQKEVMIEFYNMQARYGKRADPTDVIAAMRDGGMEVLKESQIKSWWSTYHQKRKKDMERFSRDIENPSTTHIYHQHSTTHIYHQPSTTHIYHQPSTTYIYHQPSTTYIYHQIGTTYIYHQIGTTYIYHQTGTTYIYHQPSTTYIYHQPSTTYIYHQTVTTYIYHQTGTTYMYWNTWHVQLLHCE
ncbi:hypothetical protein QZH41_000352 [Actinostola sp. cb2023]|nr:hypothetical protein QZH41_000352 [Actinostola sp. cb2023]